jgi:competence protein ComEC
MKNYPVIIFTILFVSGIAVGSFYKPPLIILLFILPMLLIAGALYFYLRQYYLLNLLYILISFSVFSSGLLYYNPPQEFPFKKTLHKEQVRFYGEIKDINISGKDEIRFTAASDSIQYDSAVIIYKGDFYCVMKNADSLNKTLFPGYKISLDGIYIKGKNIRNPGEFNYEAYLKSLGISGYIYALPGSKIIVTEDEENFLSGLIYRGRDYLADKINCLHNGSTSGLLKGILLADRKDIAQDVKNDFINSGTAHVLAVSGLHVSFIILIFLLLTGRFNLYIRSIITFSGIVAFIFITGAPPSVLRASLMALFLILGFLSNRSTNIFNSLALSALLILLIDPSQLFIAGFQLSYAAVISIGVFYPYFRDKVNHLDIKSNLIRRVLLFSGITLAAQIGILPLLLYYFSKLSLVTLVSNLIVVPLIGFILGTAFITLLIAPIYTGLAEVFASANELMTFLLNKIIYIAGNTKVSFLWVHDFSKTDCIISYFMIILMIILFQKMQTRFTKAALIIILLSAAVIYTSLDNKDILQENKLNCYMIDVGQGDAILLKFPSGKTALIDAGQTDFYFDTGERIIEPLLNYFGIKKIDYAFVSHLDSDHYSGFVHLIKNGYIEHLFKPLPDTSSKEGKFERFLSECGVDFSYYSGGVLSIDKARLYNLDNSELYKVKQSGNDLSGVLLLVYGETTFLFTGDAGFKAEELYIRKYGNMLKTDILKVSHHGSSTATSEKFLSLTKPQICLISAGEKNKFGHPSGKTLQRLNNIESQVFRTDEEGGILLVSDGFNIKKINWSEI